MSTSEKTPLPSSEETLSSNEMQSPAKVRTKNNPKNRNAAISLRY